MCCGGRAGRYLNDGVDNKWKHCLLFLLFFLDMRQSHTTIATVEKLLDGSYVLKALKQKLFVDGLCYLLQEIYGIENKNNDKVSVNI